MDNLIKPYAQSDPVVIKAKPQSNNSEYEPSEFYSYGIRSKKLEQLDYNMIPIQKSHDFTTDMKIFVEKNWL